MGKPRQRVRLSGLERIHGHGTVERIPWVDTHSIPQGVAPIRPDKRNRWAMSYGVTGSVPERIADRLRIRQFRRAIADGSLDRTVVLSMGVRDRLLPAFSGVVGLALLGWLVARAIRRTWGQAEYGGLLPDWYAPLLILVVSLFALLAAILAAGCLTVVWLLFAAPSYKRLRFTSAGLAVERRDGSDTSLPWRALERATSAGCLTFAGLVPQVIRLPRLQTREWHGLVGALRVHFLNKPADDGAQRRATMRASAWGVLGAVMIDCVVLEMGQITGHSAPVGLMTLFMGILFGLHFLGAWRTRAKSHRQRRKRRGGPSPRTV